MHQLKLFLTSPTSPSTPLVGQRVKLDRACTRCNSNIAIVGSPAAMHAARLTCDGCGTFVKWASRTEVAQIRGRFVTGISSFAPGTAP